MYRHVHNKSNFSTYTFNLDDANRTFLRNGYQYIRICSVINQKLAVGIKRETLLSRILENAEKHRNDPRTHTFCSQAPIIPVSP
jgi:hypothetical protein